MGRWGFTMTELVVVLALAALIAVAVQQGLLGQRRFYEAQAATTERNETLRFAMAVLGSALREARLADGDVEILAPDRIRFRMPHGFGVLCGAEASGRRIGVVGAWGRWRADAGDSVLVRRSTGWWAHAVDAVEAASGQVACSQSGGLILRPDAQDPDVVEGSAVRTFRSQILEAGTRNGSRWLYRVDGAQRELLLGPLAAGAGFRAWYVDAAGAVVPDLASASRVVVEVVARSPDVRGQPFGPLDTLRMTFGGRNR